MLKQMIFAPCEKVITGDDKMASLISVIESVQIGVNAELSADAMVPISWNVVSLWRRDENTDTPIEFEEVTEVVREDGSVATKATTKFRVSNSHLMYRTIVHFQVFPVGQPGLVWIKNRIRQVNPETNWIGTSEYPVVVSHLLPSPKPDASAEQETADANTPVTS
jgi:hypothetical protein